MLCAGGGCGERADGGPRAWIQAVRKPLGRRVHTARYDACGGEVTFGGIDSGGIGSLNFIGGACR